MLPAVIDATAVRLLFFTLAAWLHLSTPPRREGGACQHNHQRNDSE